MSKQKIKGKENKEIEQEKENFKELIKRFKIPVAKLEAEQKKLAKAIIENDSQNFKQATLFAGCDAINVKNKIIAAIVITDSELEVVEEKYAIEKARLPYIPGFLAYRELPAMLAAQKKLENKPDVFIIEGNGILHPRGCGLASHFGLAINNPSIGIAKKLLLGEVKNGKVYVQEKVCGETVETRKGSNPIYVSIGHNISLPTAVSLIKKFIKKPHKLPEPLALAHKYAVKIKKELKIS